MNQQDESGVSPEEFLELTQLPGRHADLIINFINRTSRLGLVVRFAGFYASIVFAFSLVYWLLTSLGINVLTHSPPTHLTYLQILYFNFTTSLTITYGDYTPIGIGRFLAIADSFLCLGWFSIFAGVVVIKLLLLPTNAITFSKYAYYIKSDERFMVVFLNTLSSQLINAQFSSFLRIGDHWSVHPETVAPYIGNSVWHYEIDALRAGEIKGLQIGGARDTLRFGISASYRFATYANAIGYALDQIVVLESRDPVAGKASLQNVQLPLSDEAVADFHYRPDGAVTFLEYARSLGATPVEAMRS